MFGLFRKKEPPKRFPPVPDWRPSIKQPLDKIIDRLKYYTNGTRDIAVFENGTCVILEHGLSDRDAERTRRMDAQAPKVVKIERKAI
jgi:hypothetical protein